MFVLFYLVKILNYLFKSRYGSRANLDPLHMPIRKRIVYDEVVQAIKGGVRQVVVFGAGLDILPLYLAREHPQVTFLEIDHPNSQLMKRAAIEKIYATLHDKFPANHVFVDVDFRSQTVAERISNKLPTWNSSAKTVGVAEGLWMYLTEAEIRASLQDFRKLGGPGSLMIFNYYTSFTQSSFGTLFRYLLAAIGEPLKYQPGTREEIARLVSSEGFKVDMEQKRCDGYERYIAGTSKAKVISKGGDLNFFGFATNE
ncbi:hypothetical protein HDU82_004911 [Entophlyctis luteolus]|nr:hypothetical protein HDU82_004911 [Entophlyctis luteolus]